MTRRDIGFCLRQDASPCTPRIAKVILKAGEDAAVLLKDDGGALPLESSALKSIVFVSPGTGQSVAVADTGEKAVELPERQIGTVEAPKKMTASDTTVHVVYAVANDMDGALVLAEFLSHNGRPG